jgi:ribonuclease HII
MARTSLARPAITPPRLIVRRDTGISAYEAALARAGFPAVAGADEAGRGACAGPLVVAACVLPAGKRGQIDGLTDSKLLTAATRERLYGQIVKRASAYSIVIVSAAEIDAYGLHVANLAGMRRAIGQLNPSATYALTDGFPVSGLGVPSTAVWKGDATVGCIAAASILAKVTRDAIMTDMHESWPQYEFDKHKGYITPLHSAALSEHGPCPQHRRRYVNVRRALGLVDDVVGAVVGEDVILGENEGTGLSLETA